MIIIYEGTIQVTRGHTNARDIGVGSNALNGLGNWTGSVAIYGGSVNAVNKSVSTADGGLNMITLILNGAGNGKLVTADAIDGAPAIGTGGTEGSTGGYGYRLA